MTVTFESRLLINGNLVDAESGATFENRNPATEEVLGACADASKADMAKAIVAARRAFDETDWSTNKTFRKRCLEELADALESEREEFRQELIAEVGCPVRTTRSGQLEAPLQDSLRWPAKYIEEFAWERDLGLDTSGGVANHRVVTKEAVGVVGAIVPWNYPLGVALDKLGPALATGNTVVLKPAVDTPFHALRLGRLVAERTSMPPGVLNVVTSSDHLVGEELVLDPRVDLISFTGSTATGRRIMEKGAPQLKRLFLELGGKSAQILLDDADLEALVPTAASLCTHAGQGCVMTTRWIVPRARYEWALDMLKTAFEAVPYGDPTNAANVMGPLINARAARPGAGLYREGQVRGGHAGYRRRPARPPAEGLLRRADRLRRPRQPDHYRSGGDLRTGALRHPPRWRRRRRPHRQRVSVRTRRRGELGIAGAVPGGGVACPGRRDQRQRRQVARAHEPVRGLQAERHRSSERPRGVRAVPRD